MAANTTTNSSQAEVPKLTLYTSHGCPWAHRAHIVLTELGLPFSEVIIPLDRPRGEWYLKEINPRGLVPALKVHPADGKEHTLIESAIISNFLIDLAFSLPSPYPEKASSINPLPTTLARGLRRAGSAYFIDNFVSKLVPFTYPMLGYQPTAEGDDATSIAERFVASIGKEIEPLLHDADPFYGGSSSVTIVEVMTGSFVLRWYSCMGAGIFPTSLGTAIKQACPRFDAWATAVRSSDVVQAKIWDEAAHVAWTKAAIERKKSKA